MDYGFRHFDQMKRMRLSLVLAVSCAAAPACNAIFGLAASTLAPDAAGAPADGAAAPDVSGAGGSGSSGCKGRAGPDPVNIDGKFCVDSTEVTNSQYAMFVASVSPATFTQPIYCSWNDAFAPPGWVPPANEDSYPVVNVDFCDAWAYCAWAGKRLCGKLGGELAGYGDYLNGELYYACSGGSMMLPYAYGGTYDASACDTSSFVPAPVKAFSGCKSKVYPGLYDLGDNYAVWQDMCDGVAGRTDTCRETEPSDNDYGVSTDYRCDVDNGDPRDHTAEGLGIRCCSDVSSP
jgi:formylglycine-generating enzyme required for sulfatase activity